MIVNDKYDSHDNYLISMISLMSMISMISMISMMPVPVVAVGHAHQWYQVDEDEQEKVVSVRKRTIIIFYVAK